MNLIRHKTKVIKIGNVKIGGNHPVVIQSMAKTKTSDSENTIRQIKQLQEAGCEIVRLAVKDKADALSLKAIKKNISIPLVADIHFDWRLALMAIDKGVDKIRLNPGNINKKDQIKQIASAASSAGIPIRVGVNSGSLITKNPEPRTRNHQAHSMVKSALDYIKILERNKFYDIVISLKASTILDTIEAYRLISKSWDYPLHLGVTATGSPFSGAIKSSIAIGALLLDGIGDTIRISLTDEPQKEVIAAKMILESLALRNFGPQIISCPTCGRCEVDLVKIVKELESRVSGFGPRASAKPLRVAVMGCVVNGPGEAKEADIGIAFGRKEGMFFRAGSAVKKVSYKQCISTLLREIERAK